MKFTGERYLPAETGELRLEHMHRYAAVQAVVRDRVVLDVACGEGYGSYILSEAAATVRGVDISKEAIDHSRR